jgi:hypothetical protein
MDDLLQQFGELVCEIAQDMQNDGYFSGSHELGEAYQTFLRNLLERRLAKEQFPRALYNLTKIVGKLTKRRPIVLIDEYDTPISYAVQHGYFPEVYP